VAPKLELTDANISQVENSSLNLSPKVDLPALVEMAVRGLIPMFDQKSQLFVYSRVQTPGSLQPQGLSPRYTIMTLMGFDEFEKAGGASPFPIDQIHDRLLRDHSWLALAGDFGLLIWLTALRAPEKLDQIFDRFDLSSIFDKFADLREGRTMESAWLLTGLAQAAIAAPHKSSKISGIADRVYRLLAQNQGKGGFFGHLGRKATASGKLRGWMGSFADQVYPTIAFTWYSQAFQSKEALQRAIECGKGICRVQGPLGQWWWHYDSREGRVASMYPVFSVHQEAMGPMALFPLGAAAGIDFNREIYRGLQWISDANETGKEMRDFENNFVWRCVHPDPEFSMKVDAMLSYLHVYRDASKRKMTVRRECRPYELGWLLFAFAGKAGQTFKPSL
jgi:hypothetical protein